MKQVQILKRPAAGDKWQFVAHGATFDPNEASAMCTLIERNGYQVKLIAL